jgi:invasion protein IalB
MKTVHSIFCSNQQKPAHRVCCGMVLASSAFPFVRSIGFIFLVVAVGLAALSQVLPGAAAQQQQQQQPPKSPEAQAFWDFLVRCTDEAQKLSNGTASAAMINTCDSGIPEGMNKYCGLEYNEEVCNPANKAMADMYYIVRNTWR